VASSATTAAPLTDPDTAFQSDSRTVPLHFETRHIGEAPASGRRWNGAPIDLDVKDADVQNVFRLIADVGKVNIVVAGDVGGTVTLKLKRVPWDQALDVVVRARGLYVERDGNVLMVMAHAPPPPQNPTP
jgi:type II secretory pathway component HofQ